ncbi:MAG TPA: chemotaxis protein CheD [Gemmatimonadaceae bacterium]|nr:chemotaxis protein CheD [Gemmatimonadaceae bacterium]
MSAPGSGAPARPAADGAEERREIRVGVAELAAAVAGQQLVTLGLGSCIAILLWDEAARVGGLAHVLLPGPELSRDLGNPARFPCTAVPQLVQTMRAAGAGDELTGRLVGGASMFRALLATAGVNIGERNIVAARAALHAAGIPLTGEDVGGQHGRSVRFDVGSGRVEVRSLSAGDRVL